MQFLYMSTVCYMIGGFGALSESWLKDKSPENCLSSVEIYDPETNSWTACPELLVPLCANGCRQILRHYLRSRYCLTLFLLICGLLLH